MKVAKKVLLLTKDNKGKFLNNENHKVLRNRAVVQDEVVAETQANYKETGLLYIVDEKATAERNNPKSETSEKDTLKAEYKDLTGDDAKGTWGVKKLTEEINKLKNIEVNED
jgi:hypothetical protein